MRKEGEEAHGLALLGSSVNGSPEVLAGLKLLLVGSRGAAAAGVQSSRFRACPWLQPLLEQLVKGLVLSGRD